MDIVACTTFFSKPRNTRSPPAATEARSRKTWNQNLDGELRSGSAVEPSISERYDMAAIHPNPKLADFYEFFALSHLSPPILSGFCSVFGLVFCWSWKWGVYGVNGVLWFGIVFADLRRSDRKDGGEKQESDYFEIQVLFSPLCPCVKFHKTLLIINFNLVMNF